MEKKRNKRKQDNAKVFHEMDAFLGGDGGLRLVPVRLVMGDAPPSQLPIPTERPDGGMLWDIMGQYGILWNIAG